jgi:hypothetical protein
MFYLQFNHIFIGICVKQDYGPKPSYPLSMASDTKGDTIFDFYQ